MGSLLYIVFLSTVHCIFIIYLMAVPCIFNSCTLYVYLYLWMYSFRIIDLRQIFLYIG